MRTARIENGGVGEVRKIPTPKNPKEGIKALANLARECAGAEGIEAAAGGFPGVVSGGVIRYAPNLPEWKGAALAEELTRALEAPAEVLNDGDCAALEKRRMAQAAARASLRISESAPASVAAASSAAA